MSSNFLLFFTVFSEGGLSWISPSIVSAHEALLHSAEHRYPVIRVRGAIIGSWQTVSRDWASAS